MSTRNYNPTGNPGADSQGNSRTIRQEFTLIQAGFSGVEGEIDAITGTSLPAKVAKAGDTYTGTHNMTGATVTVATPSSSYNPATKGYTDAAILSASLSSSIPSQTGNKYKVLSTDGALASWGVNGFKALLAMTTVDSIAYNNTDMSLHEITYANGCKEHYTYSGSVLESVQYYDTDGVTLLYTETFSYTDGVLTAVTWS